MANGNGYQLSQSQYAKKRGVSQPAVAKLIKLGKLDGAFKKIGGRYKIDPAKADAILAAYHNPARCKTSKAGPTADISKGLTLGETVRAEPPRKGNMISFAEAARREKIAKAFLLEIELKRKLGDLVEKKRVEAVAVKIATIVRTRIEAMPAKIAPRIVGMEASGEVARCLQKELRVVLTDMSVSIAKLNL